MNSSGLMRFRRTCMLFVCSFSFAAFGQDSPADLRGPRVAVSYPEVRGPVGVRAVTSVGSMPPSLSLFGQGTTTSPTTTNGSDSDANGAAGPNHYVQVVNTGIAVYSKAGNTLKFSAFLNSLWTVYAGTNPGNGCSSRNDGNPVVLYDQLADRWFITQFSLPNISSYVAPTFQCVAVSQTADPTGAYYLYDFRYNVTVNDYGKFAVWPDAYYASFNAFSSLAYIGDMVCAYDRARMLTGAPATQQCFTLSSSISGLLPTSVDGPIAPPRGEPGFFFHLKSNTSLGLYKFHVDWTTPANSTITGPTTIAVNSYSQLCNGGSCVAQPAPGNALASLGDRLMFRATYRNFGSFESVALTHSVTGSAGGGGMRWYEIRSPNATPVVAQQQTFSPDSSFRWMGSIAQDQAQDFALGYSLSSSTIKPSIAWTGRLGTDAASQMTQSETVVRTGTGVQTGTYPDGSQANRWGTYTSMTVDPADDCTFWYTNQYYAANGAKTWDTSIAAVKFANCAQNNFAIAVTPSTSSLKPDGATTYTVSTSVIAGASPESIVLNIQDLPPGVSAAFNPATLTAGASSTLTLTGDASAPVTAAPDTFTVIGKATSAVHATTAIVKVVSPQPPVNVVATATSLTQIGVTWTATNGATGYEVYRKDTAGGAFNLVGTPATNTFTDTSVSPGNAYLYRVRTAIDNTDSADSASDLATTFFYTDDPLVANTTFVKAVHLQQIRSALSAVATLAGTSPLTFTDPSLSAGTPIKSIHVTEIRAALNSARSALGLSALSFTNSAASNTKAGALDFQELRDGMK